MNTISPHSFHIPVMGLGFTIDTPVKVAKYGISSVVSIIEDGLIEQMREILSEKEQLPYTKITEKDFDFRAKRITAYLNLLHDIVTRQIAEIRQSPFEEGSEICKYFELLPEYSKGSQAYHAWQQLEGEAKAAMEAGLRNMVVPGAIDVNIMTKLDKTNYDADGNEMPLGYSDALAALRGYAESKLSSSIVFSAGLNPRLYSYCEKFADFYPDENGVIKKKIILKVSDFRSAIIQGKYLAKKGLWISEFRIESGINCGGHAFISNGILLGPILEEFKNKRTELFQELFEECQKGLQSAGRTSFAATPAFRVTVQGGIGTAHENDLLLKYYQLDATGWGSPFLLVPEATNVDDVTLQQLANAQQEDYFLSNASPLGVPFNNFRPSSSEAQRKERIAMDRPGSPCYKKYLATNKEFTERPICTASRQYQKLKIEQLQQQGLDALTLQKEIATLEEKDCLCEGLGVSVLINHHAPLPHNLSAVTICPGPNLAFFSGVFSLKQMVDHIYGRLNILNNRTRPSLFVNELQLYMDYIKEEFNKSKHDLSEKKAAYFESFRNNLMDGIAYYESLFAKVKVVDTNLQMYNLQILNNIKESLNQLMEPVTA